MGRLIDEDILIDSIPDLSVFEQEDFGTPDMIRLIEDTPTVEAIPKEEVRQFIENIQKIKDNHNEYGEPINYGTICGILIEGYRLLDKYRK